MAAETSVAAWRVVRRAAEVTRGGVSSDEDWRNSG